jgi:hypothetical protein
MLSFAADLAGLRAAWACRAERVAPGTQCASSDALQPHSVTPATHYAHILTTHPKLVTQTNRALLSVGGDGLQDVQFGGGFGGLAGRVEANN